MLVKGILKCLRACAAFVGGFVLGQLYYNFMLRDLLSYDVGNIVSLILSVTIGLLNVAAIQIRCISLLTLPMYLGKDGRRVLKGLILTYVVAGPILNMSLNAREVVRVFACGDELARNLSKTRDALIAAPLRQTVEGMQQQINHAADTLRYFEHVTAPLESEIELTDELKQSSELTRKADALVHGNRSQHIERKYQISPQDQTSEVYQKEYLKKTEYRCNNVLSAAVLRSKQQLSHTWETCSDMLPWHMAAVFCAPLKTRAARDVPSKLGLDVCDSRKQKLHASDSGVPLRWQGIDQDGEQYNIERLMVVTTLRHEESTLKKRNLLAECGLGVGYAALKTAKSELIKGPDEMTIKYQEPNKNDAYGDVQTGDRVKQAFEDKFSIIQSAITIVNACQAILFLRIAVAAQAYHDLYLTNIDFDNVYITGLFKKIEKRRLVRNQYTLLPLKKMECSRYVDVYSLAYSTADRHRLLGQMLKVLLEVVTATTFVMLDRLFYEALDVVSQHAMVEGETGTRDLEIEVEGTGIIANTLRAMLKNLRASHVQGSATNTCLPHPRIMPAIFYLRIYGGYLWVLLLLCVNPYTTRLRRLICSYFYPRREKQRLLHLYNDILKKRIKLDATLRRKAVQSVRAHYLSGESILQRFPNILGWLRLVQAARRSCLICGEIEPRNADSRWKACDMPKCPFLYCGECWLEVRGRCLACDPNLAELSDQDSLSDDELPVY